MLYLHTFGTPYLSDASGEPLTGAAAQRRLLALLAVLASAESGGVSRDRIIGILWSESETERARGALAQALYHIRRTLGYDDLVTGRDDLRLNREQITVDAWEFGEAIAAADFERAAALYRGPFLDGFFLSGAPEFERWADTQRARYEGDLAAMLDRLATTAESRHDFAAAVDYRRRRAALDPLDSAGAIRLMTTLAAAGDLAGALHHARVHEILLRDRLDVEPDPRVRQLVARFRTAADPPSAPQLAPGASVHAEVSVSKLDAGAEESEPLASPATVTMPVPPESSRARRRHVWRLATVAAVIPLTIAAILAGNTASRMQGVAPASMTAQPIIIAPFRVAGADPSLAFLREGMVELLSARLADDTSLRSVDPGIVLGGWRAAGLTTRDDAPRAEILRTAERLGASRVVVGSIVGTLPQGIVSASVIRISSGDVTAEATVKGSADSLAALVDRLAVALLAVEAGEHEGLARSMTPSLPALRAYLEGQTAYRRGDPSAAVQHYERALAADSTFALAALRLALAADRINDAEQHDRALALAWGARTELSDRDAAHLTAFAGPRYPAPSPATEQLAAWQHAASLMPDRAEVWYELGERYRRISHWVGGDGHHGAAIWRDEFMTQIESPRVGYVVKRHPRFSETFIVSELLAHEEAGLSVEIFSLRPPNDTHFQAGIAKLRVADHHRPRIVEGHPERYTARHFETGQQAADQGLDALRGRLRARSLRWHLRISRHQRAKASPDRLRLRGSANPRRRGCVLRTANARLTGNPPHGAD